MRTNEILMEQVAFYKRLNSEQANKIAARDVTIGALKESLGTYQDKVDKGVIELRDKNNSMQRWVDKYEMQGELLGNVTEEAANRRIDNTKLIEEVKQQAKLINKLDGEIYELCKVIDQQADEVNHLEAQLDGKWANDGELGALEDMGDAARHQINELMSTLDNIRTMR